MQDVRRPSRPGIGTVHPQHVVRRHAVDALGRSDVGLRDVGAGDGLGLDEVGREEQARAPARGAAEGVVTAWNLRLVERAWLATVQSDGELK